MCNSINIHQALEKGGKTQVEAAKRQNEATQATVRVVLTFIPKIQKNEKARRTEKEKEMEGKALT